MTKRARRWLSLGATAIVLAWIVFHLARSPEWRTFDWDRLWRLLVHARPEYLVAAVVVTYLTYLIRAVRWKYFLAPLKSAPVRGLFVAQVLGFSSIYLIGRPAELVRPAYIARREKVSFASQFAILLLERIYDTVATVSILAMALWFEPVSPTTARAAENLRRLHEGAYGLLVLLAFAVAGLVVFRRYSEAITARVERLFGFLPAKFRSYLSRLLRSLSSGLDAIRNWRDLLASLGCTLVLWFLNVSLFWLVFRSLPGLTQISWWAAALTLVFAAAGLMVQLPGVGGGFQVGIIQALRQIFHVRTEAATGAGILLWVVVLVPCLALGLVMLVFEGLTFKKLGTIAEEERERAAMGERI